MYPSEMKWIPSWTNWICLVFSFWLDTTSAGPTVNNATVYKKEKGKTERTGLSILKMEKDIGLTVGIAIYEYLFILAKFICCPQLAGCGCEGFLCK